ncbi:hypothetical protein Tco_1248202 [Tanacetum coccineum]
MNKSNNEDDGDDESEDGDKEKDSNQNYGTLGKTTSVMSPKTITKNILTNNLDVDVELNVSVIAMIDNTLDVGNKIGFIMVGKEQDVASILANGDHMVNQ